MKITSFIPRAGATLLDAANWIRDVSSVLTRGATLADQMSGEVRTITWNSDAPPVIATTLRPISVLMLQGASSDGSATRVSGLAVTWEQRDSGVAITAIAGTDPSTDYSMSLWLVGG